MTRHPTTAPYLHWKPLLTPDEVYAHVIRFKFLQADADGRCFWVEIRPEEAGRSVLVMRDTDETIRDLTPPPYSARSRVTEYGGSPYYVASRQIFFVNYADQRVYLLHLDAPSTLRPLTPEKNQDGSLGKYMNLTLSPGGRWLVFAYERETAGEEPFNAIGILDLDGTATTQEARILVSGADFHVRPAFSPDGATLAWLEWDHPFMPWDAARLVTAPFQDGFLDLERRTTVAGGDDAAVSAFGFAGKGDLIYSVDRADQPADSADNFWNIYRIRAGKRLPITRDLREFPAFDVVGNRLVALAYRAGSAGLTRIDLDSDRVTEVTTSYVDFYQPALAGDRIFTVASPQDREVELVLLGADGSCQVIRTAGVSSLPPEDVSPGRAVSFPTRDGGTCYGFFYPPRNPHFQAPPEEKPPVRVLVHGGPTAMAKPGFSKETAYWTSQGYAIFDVNYRGSTGFGRQYRDALLNRWGRLEIQDVEDGLAWLRAQGLIGAQAVVSGGSAGGYTVQRLLTFVPDLFSAGASYFGIGNLVTLQRLTHKYESHYLERLIGGTLETNRPEYDDRSPINHLDALKSPMIIFQGRDDKVVPPENSREMAAILARKGIRHEYHEYAGEGHGFRNKTTLVDSLQREAAFFRSVLRGETEGSDNSFHET